MFPLPHWWTTTVTHSTATFESIVPREVDVRGATLITGWLNQRCTTLWTVFLNAYRVVLGPWFSGSCRFEPSCSHYAEEAVRQHGCLRGFRLTVRRLSRCQPFHEGGYDPVPTPGGRSRS